MAFRHVAVVAAALFATAGTVSAQDQALEQPQQEKQTEKTKKLSVGDRAPELHIAQWVKGEPVTGFEKGKTYVVEFWATWCGPCIASMPHLTEIQKKYKDDVTIVAVTSRDPGNTLEKVEKMVKDKGDVMGYTVAWDDGRKTNDAYMKASGQGGIPCSFVVDPEGKIAYIGHPMWLELPLEGIQKGTWDPEKGKKQIAEAEQKFSEVAMSLRGDPKEALAKLRNLEKEYPAAAALLAGQKYPLMVKAGDPGAAELGRKMVDEAIQKKNASALNEIAWAIVDPDSDLESRDLDLALRAATKAVEFTEEKDGAILDTLAWTYFHKGDVDKAIEIQEKAVKNAPSALKQQLEQSLETFKSKKH